MLRVLPDFLPDASIERVPSVSLGPPCSCIRWGAGAAPCWGAARDPGNVAGVPGPFPLYLFGAQMGLSVIKAGNCIAALVPFFQPLLLRRYQTAPLAHGRPAADVVRCVNTYRARGCCPSPLAPATGGSGSYRSIPFPICHGFPGHGPPRRIAEPRRPIVAPPARCSCDGGHNIFPLC
jgi:hypothetical protein